METTPEQTAEGLVIVRILATVLDRLVSANVAMALADPGQVTKFHAMKAPAIGIQQYLERYVFTKRCNESLNLHCMNEYLIIILSIEFTNMHHVRMNASCSR